MVARIYGIRNCDTMKKAFSWLKEREIEYVFHDYKKEGVANPSLSQWCEFAGWEKVLNRAGTSFRKLPEPARQDLNAEKAITLMMAQPSMIKRPILENDKMIEIGFKPERYAAIFGFEDPS